MEFMAERDVQRSRAAQVGFVMRSYRESFSAGDGQRGLTQEALLERMGSVDSDYAERYSHATVSRWESGGTKPTLQRLKVFGKALNLSRAEVAGLILLAGLARDFQSAWRLVTSNDRGESVGRRGSLGRLSILDDGDNPGTPRSFLWSAMRFVLLRVLPLGMFIAGGYALSVYGWNNPWMPTAYVVVVTAVVLAQGIFLPDRGAGLREFFWVSVFFLLSTPLLQFAPIGMDHYNFYRIGDSAGTQLPYLLALLFNLLIASAAGLVFHLQWLRQYSGKNGGRSILQRAVSVTLPPVVLVHTIVAIVTNISVTIQLAILLPVLGAFFTAFLVLRDPSFNPSERDRLYLLSATSVLAMITVTLGIVAIMGIYLSPDLPRVLPDHNLLTSWEINFAELGFTREEALDRLNLGYLWHAIWVFVYMVFVAGGRVLVGIYSIDASDGR
ncbi:MAG: helix-turn-helix transcriptional regulator [Dehalococcoidia bacterium]|nr:helix-turn-helix transcriptional regulator [Dehalococcoidia bacterium]